MHLVYLSRSADLATKDLLARLSNPIVNNKVGEKVFEIYMDIKTPEVMLIGLLIQIIPLWRGSILGQYCITIF